MPKIGMRIFKTFIAVYVCFLIYLLLGKQGDPFYSAIAAILCMQNYVSNSFKVAANRTVGTFIGGIMGMCLLILEKSFLPTDLPVLQYFIVSLCIIPLIYFTVRVKKSTASYITCVVFLSITVVHGADVNPYMFAINRMIDTLIGIFVSLGINAFHLPRRKNKSALFVTNLDRTLLNSKGEINNYSKFKLNTMINRGALITIATTRSVETLLPLIKDLEMKLPVIIMNGAAQYDLKKSTYLQCKTMNFTTALRVIGVFDKLDLNCFTHTIINDVLHVYYTKLVNPAEEKLYHSKKRLPEKSYVCGDLPKNQDVLSIVAVDQLETIEKLIDIFMSLDIAPLINVSYYVDEAHEGYYFIEITGAEASVKNAVMEMKEHLSADKVIAFGNDEKNIPLIEAADFGYAVKNATAELKRTTSRIIGDNDSDSVVKTIEKHFYLRPFGRNKEDV
ncbi:HAD hydrolase family protein [Acetobacterium tundrae]|nr:HAD hydrolase family protein [Acetobacterium tundrae]